MLPDRVSNPGPLTYESGALPIALRGPATLGYGADYYRFFLGFFLQKGAKADWLERLSYAAASRREVVSSNPGLGIR